MASPFSIRWPFYLSWRKSGVIHTIASGNIENILKQFFALSSKYKGVKITYSLEDGECITLFKRGKR